MNANLMLMKKIKKTTKNGEDNYEQRNSKKI